MKTLNLTCLLILISIHYLSAQSEAIIKKNAHGLTKVEFTNNNSTILIGENSGLNLSTGLNNVLLGDFTGLSLTNGSNNVFIGNSAGNVSGGTDNVAIGYSAGQTSTGNGNIFLGSRSGFSAGSKNNSLWISNTLGDSTQAIIYGEMGADQVLRFNASTDIYSNSATDHGLNVVKNHTGNSDIPAIRSENNTTDYYGIGVEGIGGWIGINGLSNGVSGGYYYGVRGRSAGTSTIGTNYGVSGEATNGSVNYGIFGTTTVGINNYAGYFNGKVAVKALAGDSLFFKVTDANDIDLILATENEVSIKNLRAPLDAQDAATKAYVDTATSGGGRMAVYDGNGVKLGDVTGFISPGSSVSILTSTGHLITLRLDGTLKNGQIYYSGAGCTGDALLNGSGDSPIWAKTVVYSGSKNSLMVADGVLANGTVPMTNMVAQSIDNPTCGTSSGIKDGWSIVPTTPAAVGLPSYPFATPLAIY